MREQACLRTFSRACALARATPRHTPPTACAPHTNSVLHIRIEHSELDSQLTLLVSDDWVGEFAEALRRLDILNPALVRLCTVTRERDALERTHILKT